MSRILMSLAVLMVLCFAGLATNANAQTCTVNYFYQTIGGVSHGGHYAQCDYGTGQKFVTMSTNGGGFSIYLQSQSTNSGGVWNNKAGAMIYITIAGLGYTYQLDATEAGKLFNGCCYPGATQGIWNGLINANNTCQKFSIAQGLTETKYSVNDCGTNYSEQSCKLFSEFLINAWSFLA